MKRQSKKERLENLKLRLSSRYGIAGAMLGSIIVAFGMFVVPFSAVACINCVLPIVTALGLGGTVAGLAGKNAIIIIVGVLFLAASASLMVVKKYGKKTCEVKVKKK